MKESNKIKVFIVADHPVVRQGLHQIISKVSDIIVLEEADNWNEVLEKISKIKLDVILLDLEMSCKNGWDILFQLKMSFPKLPILILSTNPEDHFGIRLLKTGASGYLPKTFAPRQLFEAIRKIAGGGKFINSTMAEQLVLDLGRKTEKKLHETLSDREFQIFCMIASGEKLKNIAKKLFLAPSTVATYRNRIREKMNMESDAKLIHYAIKNGLID